MTQPGAYDAFVAFHSVRPHTQESPIRPNIVGLPDTIAQLEAHGVGAIFIPKDNYHQEGDEIVALGYLPEMSNHPAERLTLSRKVQEITVGTGGLVRAVRARINTPDFMQDAVPIVNDMRARGLGRSKYEQAQLLGAYMPRTLLIAPDAKEIGDVLDCIPGRQVVLKADSGSGGRYKRVGVPKEDVDAALAGLRAEMGEKAQKGGVVLQEMAVGHPVRELRALRAEEQPLIDDADPTGTYELGVYSFAHKTSNGAEVHQNAVYRLHPGNPTMDRWIGVDQDSVPPDFFEVASTVARRMLDHTGARGMHVRVDLFRNHEEDAMVREVNTRDPDPEVGNVAVHKVHSALLGQQLVALARTNATSNL